MLLESNLNNICEIKIKGLDSKRMPSLKHYRANTNTAKYMHLYFELNQKAPSIWRSDFNSLNSNANQNARVDQNDELHIKTWVRDMHDIPNELDRIKQNIEQCNTNYIEQLKKDERSLQSSENNLTDSLNDELEKILASLSYD